MRPFPRTLPGGTGPRTQALGRSPGPKTRKGKNFLILGAALIFLLILAAPASASNFSFIGANSNLDLSYVTDVTASSFEFDASDYEAGIIAVNFYNVDPQRIDYTLTQGDGTEHTGYIEYTRSLPLSGEQTLNIDGITHTWNFTDNLKANAYLSTYAYNEDTGSKGILLYEKLFDIWQIDHYVFSPADNLGDHPITKVYFSSEYDISFGCTYAPLGELRSNIVNNVGTADPSAEYKGDLLTVAYDTVNTAIEAMPIIALALSIFHFVFILHFFELMVIFESVILAYSCATSRDWMKAAKTFVGFNKGLFQMLFYVVEWLIGIFHKIIVAIGSLLPFT